MNESIRHEALRDDPGLLRTGHPISGRAAKGRVRACLDGRAAKVRQS
ncbi:hypothetical protein [Rhizobacter sp. Root1221]|nr:hypothetical protein [Rhizobacter sp. Root1221]